MAAEIGTESLIKPDRARPRKPMALIDIRLPVELLQRIFSRLDVRTRCRACRTQKRWHDILYRAGPGWTRLDLASRFSLGGDKPTQTNGGRIAQVFDILFRRPTSATRFTRVTRMDLSCTDVSLSIFELPAVHDTLSGTLEHLILNGCAGVEAGALYYLRNLSALRALDLSHCELVDDTALEVLSCFLPHLTHLNLSYLFRISDRDRIKQYPWAVASGTLGGATGLRELSVGEDSRMQTRGFWLLWCTFAFSPAALVASCPFLEVLRLNMVLFDLPAGGLQTLVRGMSKLRSLSVVIDRAAVVALCEVATSLAALETLEATIHVGVSGEALGTLVASGAVTKLKALKFHSRHTAVFTDQALEALIAAAPGIEYLELNGDSLTPNGLRPVGKLAKSLQSLLVHHVASAPASMKAMIHTLPTLRELAVTDLRQLGYSNRVAHLVAQHPHAARLRKIELGSTLGFSDRDLSLVDPDTLSFASMDRFYVQLFLSTHYSQHCVTQQSAPLPSSQPNKSHYTSNDAIDHHDPARSDNDTKVPRVLT
ncbi:F-box and leucine-rich repeat protein 4 [Thoreauomyces humboldtii]|nr:F-box and leucine-rich repeat protein 4 [Thoreauomyces humboldtii]